MYLEAKTSGHNGEAWIGLVSFSKTGATIYFNGRAYSGPTGNGYDTETGEPYWISGVKKRATNRHPFGSGRIRVDRPAVAALLAYLGATELDSSRYVVADAADTSVRRAEFHQQANEVLRQESTDDRS